MFTRGLLDLADAAPDQVPLPLLLDRSDRRANDGSTYFAFPYIDESGNAVDADADNSATHFWLGNVDDRACLAGTSADHLLAEFLRQLTASSDHWRAPEGGSPRLPFVQLGNELEAAPIADVAWLMVRCCEILSECAPDTRKVFAGLSNANNRGGGGDLTYYLTSKQEYLDRLFFEMVRAMLVVHDEADGVCPDGVACCPSIDPDGLTRFERFHDEDLTGYEEGLWSLFLEDSGLALTDARSLVWDAANPTHRDAIRAFSRARLRAPFEVVDFHWFNSDGDDGSFLYLSRARPYVQALLDMLAAWWSDGDEVELWCCETGISSHQNPEHLVKDLQGVAVIEDGRPGGLGRPLVFGLGSPPGVAWLGDGGWVVHTLLEPEIYGLPGTPTLAWHTCLPAFGLTDLPFPWNSPGRPGRSGCEDNPAAGFEFAVDPLLAVRAFLPAEEAPELYDDDGLPRLERVCLSQLASLPAAVFTSPDEQARQVFTRLSYLAALGVQRVFWHTNEGTALNQSGGLNDFYSWGLTEDTRVSAAVETSDLDGDGYADGYECSLQEDTATPYRERSKKAAWCSLRQWARYLGHYDSAALVSRFDGEDAGGATDNRGFYAVAFRRGAEDEDADTHPFALVVWTDAQVLPDPGAGGLDPDELLVSRTRSFRVSVADGVLVREVPTVPGASEGDDYEPGIDGLDHPCLDAGGDVADRKVRCIGGGAAVPCPNHPEERYSGAALWRFGPEEAPADAGVASFRLILDSRDPPRLVLLPDFVVHELDADGALVLDEAGDPVVLLRAEDL